MLSVKLTAPLLPLEVYLICIQCLYLKFSVNLPVIFIHSVSSPPTDLVIKLIFIDYRPVITLTWNINVSSVFVYVCVGMCVCAHVCVCVCARVCICVCLPA